MSGCWDTPPNAEGSDRPLEAKLAEFDEFTESMDDRDELTDGLMPDNEHEAHEQPVCRNVRHFRSAITRLLALVYGLVLVVLGIVFPLALVLTLKGGRNVYYMDVFHLYIYLFSLLFLLYLHVYLLRKKIERSPANIQLVSNNKLENGKAPESPEHSHVSHDVHTPSTAPARSHNSDYDADDLEPPPAVCHDSEGVNFYLRLGALLFGVGSMIHDGFAISQIFEMKRYWYCRSPLFAVVAALHLIFVFTQTFFVFKSHRIVINKHKAFVRFGLAHLIATNMCIWAKFFITESAEGFMHDNGHGPGGQTQNHVNTRADVDPNNQSENMTVNCYAEKTLFVESSPYLYPCTIEYCLIAAAILYKIFQAVGKSPKRSHRDAHEHGFDQGMECHKANKGLFFGLFIGMVTLISISLFFVFSAKLNNRLVAGMIFYSTELALLFISGITVIIGFFRLRQLRFTHMHDGHFDDLLLIVALVGVFAFNGFVIISSAGSLQGDNLIPIISLATGALTFIQATIQTIFILDGLRRCVDVDEQVVQKPGRALVTFLLLTNLALWALNTFEVQKKDATSIHAEYYGHLPWKIVSHAFIPLVIFYRFHSTVCLSDIWMHAYAKKKEH